MILLLGAAGGVGPDEDDAASVSRTSLAPNVDVFDGVLSSSPVNVTTREVEAAAAAACPACAFSSASLFLFLRRRSLADFLALFLAFSILFCLLSERISAEGVEGDAEADKGAASSSPGTDGIGPALGEASDGAANDSPFPFLLFRPLAASGFFFAREESPVSDAVTGVERTPVVFGPEAEVGAFPGVVRVCVREVAAARCSWSLVLKSGTRGLGDIFSTRSSNSLASLVTRDTAAGIPRAPLATMALARCCARCRRRTSTRRPSPTYAVW